MINRIKKRDRYRSMFFMRSHAIIAVDNNTSTCKISFPQSISLTPGDREKLISQIDKLLSLINRSSNPILLDFSKTTKISADGMIVILAELHNIKNTHSNIRFFCKKTKNKKIMQVLTQVGIFKICNQKSNIIPDREDVINWKICSGNSLIQDKFDEVLDLNTWEKKLSPETDLYGGCIEATKNVIRHAYSHSYDRKIKNRDNSERIVNKEKELWWCLSQIKDNTLSVLVYDLGASIPATIPFKRHSLYQQLKQATNNLTDADLIEGGIVVNSSSTDLYFRGNGLPKIADVARKSEHAQMTIHSRKGSVYISSKKDIQKTNHKIALCGTLISWRLQLGQFNENNINS